MVSIYLETVICAFSGKITNIYVLAEQKSSSTILSTHERNNYADDETLLDSGSIIKVLGITKRRREYDEQHANNINKNNINKKRKLMLDTILKDCSMWVKEKVLSNKEIEEYLKSDDEQQFGQKQLHCVVDASNNIGMKSDRNSMIKCLIILKYFIFE